jgi:hypothetical protein
VSSWKVGGKAVDIAGGWGEVWKGTFAFFTEVVMSQPLSSLEQEAEAQRIYQVLKQTTERDLLAIARLLASKPDRELLGKTEFEVRDRVHAIGAKAVETALSERKKGGTKERA